MFTYVCAECMQEHACAHTHTHTLKERNRPLFSTTITFFFCSFLCGIMCKSLWSGNACRIAYVSYCNVSGQNRNVSSFCPIVNKIEMGPNFFMKFIKDAVFLYLLCTHTQMQMNKSILMCASQEFECALPNCGDYFVSIPRILVVIAE